MGDILLDRDIRRAIEKNGIDYPFERISETIRSHDLAFGNLEGPLSETGFPLNKKYVFRGDPAYVMGLKNAGFNILSLANNHSTDWGREALMETRQFLLDSGLYPVGAGIDQKEARQPTLFQVK